MVIEKIVGTLVELLIVCGAGGLFVKNINKKLDKIDSFVLQDEIKDFATKEHVANEIEKNHLDLQGEVRINNLTISVLQKDIENLKGYVESEFSRFAIGITNNYEVINRSITSLENGMNKREDFIRDNITELHKSIRELRGDNKVVVHETKV